MLKKIVWVGGSWVIFILLLHLNKWLMNLKNLSQLKSKPQSAWNIESNLLYNWKTPCSSNRKMSHSLDEAYPYTPMWQNASTYI